MQNFKCEVEQLQRKNERKQKISLPLYSFCYQASAYSVSESTVSKS